MKKQNLFLLRMLIAVVAMLTATNIVAQNQISLTTNKRKGEIIELEIMASGNVNVTGATHQSGRNYRITDGNGKIILTGAITELHCNNQNITVLDLSRITTLVILQCTDNQLTQLHAGSNKGMIMLNCSYNRLRSLNISGATGLKELWASMNELSQIDLSNNAKLTGITCANNKLSILNLSKNPNLNVINCSNNNLRGGAMDRLIASLPHRSSSSLGTLGIINNSRGNETNACSKRQVANARAKGWIAKEWKGFGWSDYVGGAEVPVEDVLAEEEASIVAIYSVEGRRLAELQQGVNLIRMSNGATRKVLHTK